MKTARQSSIYHITPRLLEIDDKFIASQLKRIAIYQDRVASVDTALSETAVCCEKSGRVIYDIPQATFAEIVEVHGEEKARRIVAEQQMHKVHSLWIDTSPQSLSKLMITDPQGYFVYATGMAVIGGRSLPDHGNKAQEEAYRAFFKEQTHEKSLLWQKCLKVPMHEIVAANEILRRFLSHFQAGKIRRHIGIMKQPIMTHWLSGELSNLTPRLMQRCISHIIKAALMQAMTDKEYKQRIADNVLKKNSPLPQTHQEIASRIYETYGATSMFALQKKTKLLTFAEQFESEIDELLDFTDADEIAHRARAFEMRAESKQKTARSMVIGTEAHKPVEIKTSVAKKGETVLFSMGSVKKD